MLSHNAGGQFNKSSCILRCVSVQTDNRPTNKRQPEITLSQKCSKQEIEAKRLAALNRLMMKKKR